MHIYLNLKMSSTAEQVKASKEEKRKKLEELRARKKLREE
jgi:hypothetical protein